VKSIKGGARFHSLENHTQTKTSFQTFQYSTKDPTMSKILTVFGATGNQGGSVVKSVLSHPVLSQTYKIRAVTRNVTKPAAVALKEQGCEVVSADMSDRESIFKAIEGSSAVFGVTNFWETMNEEIETQQGRNMADASKAAKVERFIFSSLVNVTRETKGKITQVKHFDSKAKVEEYAREIGLPGSYVMPGVFMPFILGSFKKDNKGDYTWTVPFNPDKTKVPMLSPAEDIGRFVGAVLLDLPGTLNKRVLASSGYVTPNQAAAVFAEATGEKAGTMQITMDQFKSYLPPASAEELGGNMQLIEDPGYYVGEPSDALDWSIGLVAQHEGLGKLVTWKDYVTKNFKN
jgi:uncharacterized protein YbjT (DUF2867 family)